MRKFLACLGIAALLALPVEASAQAISGVGLPSPQTTTPCTAVSTTALAASLVVNAAPAKICGFEVQADSTLSAAAWYIMVFNATSLPADGAVTPIKCYPMAAGTTGYAAAFSTGGTSFGTGITIGVSTTGCFTKTASTHALFISGDYQ